MFQTNVVAKIRTHILSSDIFFLSKIVSFWDNVEIFCRVWQTTDGNMANAHCMLDTWGYRRTLRICNTYCFCMETTVVRTRLGVAFYVQCPFCVHFILAFRSFYCVFVVHVFDDEGSQIIQQGWRTSGSRTSCLPWMSMGMFANVACKIHTRGIYLMSTNCRFTDYGGMTMLLPISHMLWLFAGIFYENS